jgi:hypothetical protein
MMASTGASERRPVTMEELAHARLRAIKEISRLEALLGKARVRRMPGRKLRRGGLIARNLERREHLKLEIAQHRVRLTAINAAIKAGRRSANLLLLHGVARPSNERELIAAMYRMFTDVIPPAEQDDQQRIIMRLARDYTTSGVIG